MKPTHSIDRKVKGNGAGQCLSELINKVSSFRHGAPCFVRTETLQMRKGGKWIDVPAGVYVPMDASARNLGLPKKTWRWTQSVRPITESEAVDWYLTTSAPESLSQGLLAA